tara:strand:+ start:42 stop:149 length:108 start_codon:yes stop_codon:yes gene_type:complete
VNESELLEKAEVVSDDEDFVAADFDDLCDGLESSK